MYRNSSFIVYFNVLFGSVFEEGKRKQYWKKGRRKNDVEIANGNRKGKKVPHIHMQVTTQSEVL